MCVCVYITPYAKTSTSRRLLYRCVALSAHSYNVCVCRFECVLARVLNARTREKQQQQSPLSHVLYSIIFSLAALVRNSREKIFLFPLLSFKTSVPLLPPPPTLPSNLTIPLRAARDILPAAAIRVENALLRDKMYSSTVAGPL